LWYRKDVEELLAILEPEHLRKETHFLKCLDSLRCQVAEEPFACRGACAAIRPTICTTYVSCGITTC
jgi:hypothetical protein